MQKHSPISVPASTAALPNASRRAWLGSVSGAGLALAAGAASTPARAERVATQAHIVIAGSGLGGLEPQVALHLAALQLGAEALTQNRLQAAQLFRQANVGLQIALVDRTNFPNGCAPVALEFLAGVGGHAVNH